MSDEKKTFPQRDEESERRTDEQLPDLAAQNDEQVKGGFSFVIRQNSTSPT